MNADFSDDRGSCSDGTIMLSVALGALALSSCQGDDLESYKVQLDFADGGTYTGTVFWPAVH